MTHMHLTLTRELNACLPITITPTIWYWPITAPFIFLPTVEPLLIQWPLPAWALMKSCFRLAVPMKEARYVFSALLPIRIMCIRVFNTEVITMALWLVFIQWIMQVEAGLAK